MKACVIVLAFGILFLLVSLYSIYRIVKKKEDYMAICAVMFGFFGYVFIIASIVYWGN